jgi:cytochrome bd-type quinol oxidase subunit 1
MAAQWVTFGVAATIVVALGVWGYFVEPITRIRRFSPLQVAVVLLTIVIVMAIDIPMFKGARSTGVIRWGTIAPRSQYVLILLAVSFTWLMGLMGFARSGIRQHWHIYGVLQDTSPDAVTPALGYAANVISVTTILFFAMVMFIFWLGGLGARGAEAGHAAHGVPGGAPQPLPISGGVTGGADRRGR